MESFDDRELRELLRTWNAPDAPASLENAVAEFRRAGSRPRGDGASSASGFIRAMRWLVTGSIRVPAPLVAALVVLAILLYGRSPREEVASPVLAPAPSSPPLAAPPVPARARVALDDFTPVVRLEPRIVGEQR